jgi:uncharacterized membrane protein
LTKAIPERRIHQLFEVGVTLKGVHALIECIGGLALVLVSTAAVQRLVTWATQDEIAEDPGDFIAGHMMAWAQTFSVGTKNFFAFYLLSHGIVKLFLVAGLLRNRACAYPASLIVLGLFIVYQVYRVALTQSFGLIVLTIFDLIVVVLIWHEYRLIRRRNNRPA